MATIAEMFAQAVQHHQAGELPQAEGLYRQILQVCPTHVDALHLLGVLAFQVGRADLAVDFHCQALRLCPHVAGFHFDLAVAYRALGRRTEAIAAYQQSLALQPDNAAAHNNLGNALREEGQLDAASAHFRTALQLVPDYAEAHNNLGNVLRDLGQREEAAESYRRAIHYKPDYAGAYSNLGVVLSDLGKLDEAATYLEQALRLVPDYTDAHYNLGSVLLHLGKAAEAEVHFEQALRLAPDHIDACNGLGAALDRQGKRDEALACFERTLRVRPDHVTAHWNRALHWLEEGNFEQGWPEYEWRLEFPRSPLKRSFAQPRWDGSQLGGRTILLYTEGGFGDALHFVRYAPLVAQRGGHVLLECQPPLVWLLRSVAGIERVIARGEPLPPFDVHSPLQSLPLVFRTTMQTIPAAVPYVYPDAERMQHWRRELERLPGFKIGVVWQGSLPLRSIPLECFTPLAGIPGVQLIRLQKGPGTEPCRAVAQRLRLVDWGEQLDESGAFRDTAAIMKHLDLVLSVDTAPAHLAGALGVPVWVALPSPSDFRWLLQRQDSPWYPTMRLFRQRKAGDWNEVFDAMTEALRPLVAGKTPHPRAATSLLGRMTQALRSLFTGKTGER